MRIAYTLSKLHLCFSLPPLPSPIVTSAPLLGWSTPQYTVTPPSWILRFGGLNGQRARARRSEKRQDDSHVYPELVCRMVHTYSCAGRTVTCPEPHAAWRSRADVGVMDCVLSSKSAMIHFQKTVSRQTKHVLGEREHGDLINLHAVPQSARAASPWPCFPGH